MTTGLHDWRDRKLSDWLLLLLRFAVTRDPTDQMAVLALADEIDAVGLRWRPGAPSFFARTSREVCEAILAGSDRHNDAVLQRHAARIDDPRLRRAFRAAAGLHPTSELQRHAAKSHPPNEDLWRGLPTK
jgi:hypothetical protein